MECGLRSHKYGDGLLSLTNKDMKFILNHYSLPTWGHRFELATRISSNIDLSSSKFIELLENLEKPTTYPRYNPKGSGICKLKNKQLQILCKNNGLPIYGARADLVNRLVQKYGDSLDDILSNFLQTKNSVALKSAVEKFSESESLNMSLRLFVESRYREYIIYCRENGLQPLKLKALSIHV